MIVVCWFLAGKVVNGNSKWFAMICLWKNGEEGGRQWLTHTDARDAFGFYRVNEVILNKYTAQSLYSTLLIPFECFDICSNSLLNSKRFNFSFGYTPSYGFFY